MAAFTKSIPAGQRALVHLVPTSQGGSVATPAIVLGAAPPATPAPNTLYAWCTVHTATGVYSAVGLAADVNGVYVQNSTPPVNATIIDFKASFAGATGPAVALSDMVTITLLADPDGAKTLTCSGIDDPIAI